MKSFDLIMDIKTSSDRPAAVQALAGAPTQPQPQIRKPDPEAKPASLPPSPKPSVVGGND
jgi:hypothetical protein